MKNQYFGDRRDARKYDLWFHVATLVPYVDKITFVPMLTPDDGSNEGRVRSRPILYDSQLWNMLQQNVASYGRNISGVRRLIPAGVHYRIHAEARFFHPPLRQEYFQAIDAGSLTKSIVLLDPDIGLECGSKSYLKKMGEEKYVRYDEVADVCRRMDRSSIMMIYQHLQRNAKRAVSDLVDRASRLTDACHDRACVVVRDHDVAFFFLGREEAVAPSLAAGLANYASVCGLPVPIIPSSSSATRLSVRIDPNGSLTSGL